MKIVYSLMLSVAALAVCGGVLENSSVLTIGTSGPDCYGDGTTVLDGELYALVWRASAATEVKFVADGSTGDSETTRVLCLAPLARGGRCPETTFVVDSRVLAACGNGKGGRFGLYLLDTRRWAAKGEVSVGGQANIHGSVLLRETASVSSFAASTGVTEAAFLESALPADVGQPTITGIRMEGDAVVLTVEGTSAAVNYNVAGGESAAASEVAAAAERPVSGDDEPIELRVPRAKFGDRAFFRIVRNPLEVKE